MAVGLIASRRYGNLRLTCGDVRQRRLHAVVVVLQITAIAEKDVLVIFVIPACRAPIPGHKGSAHARISVRKFGYHSSLPLAQGREQRLIAVIFSDCPDAVRWVAPKLYSLFKEGVKVMQLPGEVINNGALCPVMFHLCRCALLLAIGS